MQIGFEEQVDDGGVGGGITQRRYDKKCGELILLRQRRRAQICLMKRSN